MVWFKVDDGLHKHRKVRKVLAEDPGALGLWTVAGSWSSDEGTDGFIADDQLPWLLPNDGERLAQVLVNARLWKRVKGGYQFHQWAEDGDGTKRNPTRAEVEAERRKKVEAGRKGGLASGKTRSTSEARASADAPPPAKHMHAKPLNPRPDPTRPDHRGGSSKRDGHVARDPGPEPPPDKCDRHTNDPDPPNCGACGDRRRARETWDAEQAQHQRREAAIAKSRTAKERAELVAREIRACHRCDHLGRLPDQRVCTHEPEPARAAELAAAARANIRPGPAGRQRADPIAEARRPDRSQTALDDALGELGPTTATPTTPKEPA